MPAPNGQPEHLHNTDRSLFQRIWDEIKHIARLATAGSREARQLEHLQYDFVQNNKNNINQRGKSYYAVTLNDGATIDIPFDVLLHTDKRHSSSKGQVERVVKGINNGISNATVGAKQYSTFNGVPVKMVVDVGAGEYAGVLIDYIGNGRKILRTAFYDTAERLSEWAEKDGFKALASPITGESSFLDNRLSVNSISKMSDQSQAENVNIQIPQSNTAAQNSIYNGTIRGKGVPLRDLRLEQATIDDEQLNYVLEQYAKRIVDTAPRRFIDAAGYDQEVARVSEVLKRNYLQGLATGNGGSEAVELYQRNSGSGDTDTRSSVVGNVAAEDGSVYNGAVSVNSDIFKGHQKRDWKNQLKTFVSNKLAGKMVTTFDENGNSHVVQFAKENERVRKDGDKNSHFVLGKLQYKNDRNSQLAVANAVEMVEVSFFDGNSATHKSSMAR